MIVKARKVEPAYLIGSREAFVAKQLLTDFDRRTENIPNETFLDHVQTMIKQGGYVSAVQQVLQSGFSTPEQIDEIERNYEFYSSSLPANFISLEIASELFGGIPHELPGEVLDVGKPEVRKFSSSGSLSGDFVRKELEYAYRKIPEGIDLMKKDALLRGVTRKFFPKFIVPEACYYLKDDAVYVVSRFVENDIDEDHFYSMGPKLQAELSILALVFGLSDLAKENVCKSRCETYETHQEYYDLTPELQGERKNKYAIIDVGIGYTDEPRNILYSAGLRSDAKYQAPFLDKDGKSKPEDYLNEHKGWKEFLEDGSFIAGFYSVCQDTGLTKKESDDYFRTVRTNLDNYLSNLETYLVASRDTLPQTLLSSMGWQGNPEPKMKDITGTSDIVRDFSCGKQIILNLNKEYYLLVEAIGNGKILVRSTFEDAKERVLGIGEEIKIGRDKSSDMLLNLPIASIHVLVRNQGDGELFLEDKQTRISKLSTAYWM